jgi:hypothetical protein
VTEPRRERPLLATAICIYEIFTAFVPLPIAWIFLFALFHSAPLHHSILPQSTLTWVNCALAIAGAVALWQMRRSAFFLLATRFGLSLLMSIIRLPRAIANISRLRALLPPAVIDSIVLRVGGLLIIAQWVIGALIVWYVYQVTKPEAPTPPIYVPQNSPGLS